MVRISPEQLSLLKRNLKRAADPASAAAEGPSAGEPARGKRGFRFKAPTISENDVEAGCIDLLRLHDYWVVKLHAGVFQSLDGRRHIRGVRRGVPDFACLHESHRNFLLEVKRPGGELSIEQQTEIAMLQLRYRLPIVVVESANELSNFLARHERSPKGP